MKGLSQLMRQAQEMQANMQKAQDELAATEVEGVAGGGMVKVVVTCKHEVRRVTIEDSAAQRRQGDARGPRGGRVQRREPQGRADRAAEAVVGHGRYGIAGRVEAAVLSDVPDVYSPLLNQLIEAFQCLPGVGSKTAQRMAFHLLDKDREARRPPRRDARARRALDPQLRALPNVDRGSPSAASAAATSAIAVSCASSRRPPTCWRSSSPGRTAARISC